MKQIEINSQAFRGRFALEVSSFVEAYLTMVREHPSVFWHFEASSRGRLEIFAIFSCDDADDDIRRVCGRQLAGLLPRAVVRSFLYPQSFECSASCVLRVRLDF